VKKNYSKGKLIIWMVNVNVRFIFWFYMCNLIPSSYLIFKL
jgi:hypothetical protein